MGELYYTVLDHNGDERELQFSDDDEEWGCLCTFAHNDGDTLTPDRVRSLALFGAACRLEFDNLLPHGILPGAVPQWIRDEIKRIIPIEEKNEIVHLSETQAIPLTGDD